MKRIFLITSLILTLLTVNTFAVSVNKLNIDGEDLELKNALIATEMSVDVSLREVAEALNMTVEWDSEQSAISVTNEDETYYFKVGSNLVTTKYKKTVNMTSPAYINNGATYIPLNAVVDVFGLELAKSDVAYEISSVGQANIGVGKTIDELYILALENSESLKTAEKNVERYEITQEEAQDDLSSSPSGTGNGTQDATRLAAFQNYYSQGIGLEMAEITVESTKEQIYHDLLSVIESVHTETERLALLEESLEVAKVTVEQNKLKK